MIYLRKEKETLPLSPTYYNTINTKQQSFGIALKSLFLKLDIRTKILLEEEITLQDLNINHQYPKTYDGYSEFNYISLISYKTSSSFTQNKIGREREREIKKKKTLKLLKNVIR